MNVEQIDAIKKANPELWRAKRAAGLDEIQTAVAIQSQLDTDAANPPKAEARRRVARAAELLKAHLAKASLAHGEMAKIIAEVKAEFPDLEIEVDLDDNLEVLGGEVEDANAYLQRLNAEIDLERAKVLERDDKISRLQAALSAIVAASNIKDARVLAGAALNVPQDQAAQ